MTMDDFLNSSPEEIQEAVSSVERSNDLANEVVALEGEVKELERQLEAVKDEINAWLDDFNKGITGNLVERSVGLKKAYEQKMKELKTKNEELAAKRTEYEEQLNKEKKETMITRAKNTFNKIKVNTKNGIKTTKKVAKTVSAIGAVIAIKSTEKFKSIYGNLKEKTQNAKEWVKEDLKKGVVYNTVETVKEKAPEVTANIKENAKKAKLKINKAKSAIAQAPKKTVGGIKAAFSKVSVMVNGVKTVVVAKGKRFANRVKDTVTNEVDYMKTISEINKNKRVQLEAYKKQLEEEARLMKQEAKTGRSL